MVVAQVTCFWLRKRRSRGAELFRKKSVISSGDLATSMPISPVKASGVKKQVPEPEEKKTEHDTAKKNAITPFVGSLRTKAVSEDRAREWQRASAVIIGNVRPYTDGRWVTEKRQKTEMIEELSGI